MSLFPSQWPSGSQWRQFFKVLSRKEKKIFFVFLFLAVFSLLLLFFTFYFKHTEIVPDDDGIYIEAVIGSPRFINPLYAATSDVDRDLTELIYSGLMKYDAAATELNKIIPDLIKEYKISEDGKVYEFYLKDNLLWSDGAPLTADDVVFTIKTIQNPSFKSPIRASWLGVEVEKISDSGIRFELKNPSTVFLENCTLKILPQHLWEKISTENFPLSIYNLKPIGSGPYKLKSFTQDNQGNIKSMDLVVNNNYAGSRPHISKIVLYFVNSESEIISASKSREIKGFSLSSLEKAGNLKDFSEYRLSLPRYFALFFNPVKSEIFSDDKIREALNYGTDKEEIVREVLSGQGEIIDSPLLPGIYGFENPTTTYGFDLEKAKQLLTEAGFTENENGVREKDVKKEPAFQFKSVLTVGSQGAEVQELQKCLAKDPEIYPEGEITGYFGGKTKEAVIKFQEKYAETILKPAGLEKGTGDVKKSTMAKLNELCAAPSEETLALSFIISTVNQPVLIKVADILKNQWKKIGVNLEIKTSDISTLETEVIKPRNYEIILFGEVLGAVPDPYPFWHSSQVKDPGLNLAGYENKDCDKLLEEARETQDLELAKKDLEKFQDILIKDAPAVFLYSQDYLYFVSNEIKGIDAKIITDPSKRFSGIENWYIKTKRAWK
ncbi:MAG: hypothetical protein A2175_00235 [Candidatus Nealsonbacteria bacterium RBG_13_42_11]|uniref:Solute-binding protein family 5 domain-containing protein n=1 Tax=Candidatus Nealsonbacteria bacterium RBG_13_42_11 TaxID=1801663 RepID=A0A1G2DYL8_9BACT|nr:MAG: hypothetical protein A2175_00235 [Candidatus Nealsonbacteria bacterium RBG_13_42_11]